MRSCAVPLCYLSLLFLTSSPASAVTTVFTEDFVDSAGWLTGGYTALTEFPVGGPDGSSYVSLDAAFSDIGRGTIYRGHEAFNASGGAFADNWIDSEYVELSALVRHNAPEPLNYYVRLATPANFPAATVESPVLVQPNTWTEVIFDARRGSPQITSMEGSDYDTIFSNIGNVQLAVSVPVTLETDASLYTFDLDKVSLASVPEPTALVLLASGCLLNSGRRRKR